MWHVTQIIYYIYTVYTVYTLHEHSHTICMVSQVALVVKNLPAKAGALRDPWFNPWVRKIPLRMKWQCTPVFLPGESHGEKSLAGYSSWSQQSDIT